MHLWRVTEVARWCILPGGHSSPESAHARLKGSYRAAGRQFGPKKMAVIRQILFSVHRILSRHLGLQTKFENWAHNQVVMTPLKVFPSIPHSMPLETTIKYMHTLPFLGLYICLGITSSCLILWISSEFSLPQRDEDTVGPRSAAARGTGRFFVLGSHGDSPLQSTAVSFWWSVD